MSLKLPSSRLSIGIPTRNRAKLVSSLVPTCLTQTRPPLEVIVSDNASEDDTLDQLRNISHDSLHILQQKTNIGMVGNWNACLAASTGDWFVLLSDDDLVDPDFVENFERALTLCPDVDILIMRCRTLNQVNGVIDENVPPIYRHGEIRFFDHLAISWANGTFAIPLAGVIFRTSLLKERNGFSDHLPFAADVATWLPIVAKFRVGFWPDTKITYVYHQGMTTNSFSTEALLIDALEVTKMVEAEIQEIQHEKLSKQNRNKAVPKVLLASRFNNLMIRAARANTPKGQLVGLWLKYASKLPLFGVGVLSFAAVIVPSGYINFIGWPYRKYFLVKKRFFSTQSN